MHAGGGVEPDALGLSVGMAEDGSSHLPQVQGRSVEHGVFGVVPQAVGDHEVEVALQVCY